MEMGMGFLLGLLGGLVVVGIMSVIVFVSRRAVSTPKAPANGTAETIRSTAPAKAEAKEEPADKLLVVEPPTRRSGHTVIVDEVEANDQRLNQNIQEVRELLLRLADVVAHTGDASGRAAKAFHSAKDTIHGINFANAVDLEGAQKLLIQEIDRVLKTNAELHKELDQAKQGIATQRRQIEELRVQARIDGLTRIPNRAAFDERLQEYLALLKRTGLVFCLLLLDIDHFKKVNDEYGHLNGDRILRGLAAKITAAVRTNDFAARYGGEEFAVIFPGTVLKDALMVSERMRQDIAKTNFRMDNVNLKMTVSGGLAECDKDMQVEDVITAADKALYNAKNQGRNTILAHNGNA